MRSIIRYSVVIVALCMSIHSFGAGRGSASAPRCEAVFGSSTAANTGSTVTGGGFSFGSGWDLGGAASYHHLFTDEFQLGGRLQLNVGDTTGGTRYLIGALVGPTFNFMNSVVGDISDAVFVFAGIGFGVMDAGAGGSTSGLMWGAEIGKRFKVWDSVSYRPSFSVNRGLTGGNLAFSVNLLNISILY